MKDIRARIRVDYGYSCMGSPTSSYSERILEVSESVFAKLEDIQSNGQELNEETLDGQPLEGLQDRITEIGHDIERHYWVFEAPNEFEKENLHDAMTRDVENGLYAKETDIEKYEIWVKSHDIYFVAGRVGVDISNCDSEVSYMIGLSIPSQHLTPDDLPLLPPELASRYEGLEEQIISCGCESPEYDAMLKESHYLTDNYGFRAFAYKAGNKMGMKTVFGDILIPARYDEVGKEFDMTWHFFTSYMAKRDGKFCLVKTDGSGKELTPAIYDEIIYNNCGNGFLYSKNGSKLYGYMDFEGKELTECIFDGFPDENTYRRMKLKMKEPQMLTGENLAEMLGMGDLYRKSKELEEKQKKV